ncbi:MAG: hypothetical protein AB8B72_13655 [Crocinitomicaceae bacterium]
MRRKEIDTLLDALDTAVNSNSFWITLPVNEDKNMLEKDIIQHLKTGSFHFELVKDDIRRGLYQYSELIFPKGIVSPTVLQTPGNVWNEKENLTMKLITREMTTEFLIDLLTGSEKYFSKSHLGTQYNYDDATNLAYDFLEALNENGKWEAYNIKPDFLNQIDDFYNTNYIQLGYFENCGRDLALGIVYEDEINILLVNGYS